MNLLLLVYYTSHFMILKYNNKRYFISLRHLILVRDSQKRINIHTLIRDIFGENRRAFIGFRILIGLKQYDGVGDDESY